jgi:RHS repeat-associated protein
MTTRIVLSTRRWNDHVHLECEKLTHRYLRPEFNCVLCLRFLWSPHGQDDQRHHDNYVYDELNPVQEKNGGTVTANLSTDEFFTRTDGVGSRALLPDALGSTVALGDNIGTLQTQYTYEPFGVASQTGAASTNSYKYTGREDDGTGLFYYRARYYQPRLQRFISEDPIAFQSGDINFYAYVLNNPNKYVDPDGTIRLPPGIGGMPPRAPVPSSRPSLQPRNPQLHRPLEPQLQPEGPEYIPKPPWWMQLLKRLLGGDDDLNVTMPGVLCIN